MKSCRMAAFLFVGPLALAAILGALPTPYPAQAQTATQVNITLREFSITPSKITVPQGQPVHFTVTNAGTIEHNFTVELEKQGIEQKLFDTNLRPGESRMAEFTFSVAGDWEMYCPVDQHEDHGMKGAIEVMGSTPAGMPRTGNPMLPDLWPVGALVLALLGGGLLARRRSYSGGRA